MEQKAPWESSTWLDRPLPVAAECFARLPVSLRKGVKTSWGRVNAGDAALDCFLEGPCFSPDGKLFVTDIPHGRIFRIDGPNEWSVVAEYDGWPNGLKYSQGRLLVADYRLGLLKLDSETGRHETLAKGFRSEGFKGVNDLFVAGSGDLYFTDQGQTGWHDPTGRVFRMTTDGALECLCDRIPSPNGLCMNLAQTQLYVAVTRANAIWRLPLMVDGSVSKVGTYIQMSGGAAGPDGIALDAAGGLVVAHPGTTVWRFNRWGLPTHYVQVPHDSFFTNLAFGPGLDSAFLYMTDALRGEIWRARMPAAN